MENENAARSVDTMNGAWEFHSLKGKEVLAETKDAPFPATSPSANETPKPCLLKNRTMMVS